MLIASLFLSFFVSGYCFSGAKALAVVKFANKALMHCPPRALAVFKPMLPPSEPLPDFSVMLARFTVKDGRYPYLTSSSFPMFTHEIAGFDQRVLELVRGKYWAAVTSFVGFSHVSGKADFAAFAHLCEVYIMAYCEQHQKEDLLMNRSELAASLYRAIKILLHHDLFKDFDYSLVDFWSLDTAKSVEEILYTGLLEAEEYPMHALRIRKTALTAVESVCRGA